MTGDLNQLGWQGRSTATNDLTRQRMKSYWPRQTRSQSHKHLIALDGTRIRKALTIMVTSFSKAIQILLGSATKEKRW